MQGEYFKVEYRVDFDSIHNNYVVFYSYPTITLSNSSCVNRKIHAHTPIHCTVHQNFRVNRFTYKRGLDHVINSRY